MKSAIAIMSMRVTRFPVVSRDRKPSSVSAALRAHCSANPWDKARLIHDSLSFTRGVLSPVALLRASLSLGKRFLHCSRRSWQNQSVFAQCLAKLQYI